MRIINTDEIINNIKEMCIEANHYLAPDMLNVFNNARKNEKSPLGCQILEQLDENLKIAAEDMIPICQDTGMAVVFMEIGQDVHIEGENLEDAINEGVRRGYVDGYLRKSVVSDPIIRENTKDNTPAVIHYSIVPGENIKITLAPKGFGSENMSRVFMLKPADGIEGVKDAVITAVKDAGPNACPPMVVGVGTVSYPHIDVYKRQLLIKEGDKKPVFLTIKDTEMELSINTFIGSMDESIPISKEGSDIMISFNPKFLIDILKVLDQEQVSIFFTNPKAPCFIRDEENSYIYIVLPVVQ